MNQFSFTLPGLSLGAKGDEVVALQTYLCHYGYLRGIPNKKNDKYASIRGTDSAPQATVGQFDQATESALQHYQRFHKLPVSGQVDKATIINLRRPRCGYPDIVRALDIKTINNGGWKKKELTVWFDKLSSDYEVDSIVKVTNAMAIAFRVWTGSREGGANIRFKWAPVKDEKKPDIMVTFGKHDGIGGEVAYAYGPPDGDILFDDAELWTTSLPTPTSGTDFIAFAIHELGHSLGLDHRDDDSDSIMQSSIPNGKRDLSEGDKAAIQALYPYPR